MRNIQKALLSGSTIAFGAALTGAAPAAAAEAADSEAPVIVTTAAQAAAQAGEAADDVVDSGDVLIVTGTRRSNRTVSESPVPIDVIGGEQLRQSGLVETARLLRDLVPSLNFPQPSITDGTDAIRPAPLRGLGPD
jgi:iron complex outermembrane receptor protein